MKVKEVMHHGASWIDPDAPISDVAERMRKEDIGAIPIGDKDRLIGMVTDRDIVVRGLSGMADPLQLTARDVMSEPIVYCSANEELDDAIRIMERKQIRRLPVIDEHRRLVGMLSLGDVAAQGTALLCAEALRAVSAHHA
ncbi:MAG: CBS domain-containing protein [Novosphingobium sp.]